MGQWFVRLITRGNYDEEEELLSSGPANSSTLRAFGSLLVLFAVYVLTQADRQLLPAVIPSGLRCYNYSENDTSGTCHMNTSTHDKKRCDPDDCIDFTDMQHGILAGAAYMLAYGVTCIPISRLADKTSRTLVISFGMFFWSAMVLATGLSREYLVILLARIGVGIGEASCSPSSYAIISDFYYSHRTKAFGFYHLGMYIGSALGYGVAAANSLICWRWPFFILAFLGFLMVVILVLFLRDPEHEERILPEPVPTNCKETALQLLKCKPYVVICLASSVRLTGSHALITWLPTYYARYHTLTPGIYNVRLASIVFVAGCLGNLGGAIIADRVSVNKKQAKTYVIGISHVLATPLIAGVFLVEDFEQSFLLFFFSYLVSETWIGVCAAIVQDLTVPDIRATASATYIVINTVIGGILGPLLVPLILHLMHPDDNCDVKVGEVLLIILPTCYGLSAVLFTIVGILIKKQIENQSVSYLHFDTAELEASTTSLESETFSLANRSKSYSS
ncbi:MFS-type efflux pump MSMEG_3705-like [Glandiceps talaboti]